jgi:hypothetical protein
MQRFLFICCAVAVLLLGGQHTSAQTAVDSVKITLTGENFTRQSTVFVGSTQYTPTYNDPTKLTITIPRSMITSAQPNNVRVVNPSAGGGSSNSIPIVVTCRTAEPIQLASFSMRIKTTTYSDLSKTMNEDTLTEGQKMNLRLSRMQYQSKVVLSGTYFRDGNANVQITFVPMPSLASPDISLTTPAAIRTVFMKSSEGSVKFFTASNENVFSTTMDSVPFKPLMDRMKSILDQIKAAAQAPNTQPMGLGAGPAPIGPPPVPAPTDSNIIKSIYLSDAVREGFQVTLISPGRYSVLITPKPNIPLATNEVIRLRVKAPEDVIERYEIFRDNLLQHRIRYMYDPTTLQNPIPHLQETISTSFYVLEGLPMKYVSVDEYEDYTINLTQ